MEGLLTVIAGLLRSALALFRSRSRQAIIERALRQQLAVYSETKRKPRLRQVDRKFWIALRRLWPRWREVLVIVKPDTVVWWHRKGFRLYWRWISKRGPGRPPILAELQELIQRFAAENGWGARKIDAELEKLGFRVGLATVSRYLPATNVASLTLGGHLRRFIPDMAMMKTAHERKSEKGAVQQEPGAGC